MQVPRQAHHERQLDLLLEEPAPCRSSGQPLELQECPHGGCRRSIAWKRHSLRMQAHQKKAGTRLSPEFTMAAGTDRPKNPISPLMNPGKFCRAPTHHQYACLEYTECSTLPELLDWDLQSDDLGQMSSTTLNNCRVVVLGCQKDTLALTPAISDAGQLEPLSWIFCLSRRSLRPGRRPE